LFGEQLEGSSTMRQNMTLHNVEEPRQLRQALGHFATGVAVVTTRSKTGKLEGLTINSFSAVSLDPPLVLWSIQKTAPSFESFRSAGHFAINVLGVDQLGYCQHFSKKSVDKFLNIEHGPGLGGCPVFEGCVATFECDTHDILKGGDHFILLGRVKRAACGAGDPLIFSAGAFCRPALVADTDREKTV
jgi:flavin reductase (DIM6/NTAB) family NADH-FMN oxidoreductase RutF